MDILGVGVPELIVVFLIMLVVAGPRRMTQWAFLAGRELRKLRGMWAEAKGMIRQELEAAGFTEEEIQQVKKLPNELTNAARTVTNPVGAASKQLGKEVKKTTEATTTAVGAAAVDLKKATTSAPEQAKEAAPPSEPDSGGKEADELPPPEAQAFKTEAPRDASDNGAKPGA
ncbi:MAG: hypothetical protein JXB47_20970 [Anaerolineae bacterium]|nr:hypothetical protein [Anaerolineae bacterium]